MHKTSEFFYELTPEKILTSVERLGVRCTGKITALNSVENRVYDVEIEVEEETIKSKYDRSRIIKFYRPGRWSKNQILEELEFIKDLKERGLPVVPPLETEPGKILHSVAGLDGDLYFALFPRVGGRILDEYSDEQVIKLGHLIARMHQCARSKASEFRISLTPEIYGINNCKYLVDNKIIPPEIENRYSDLVKQICEISKPWFDSVPLQRLHGDCHLGNILWLDQDCTFVDFDDFVMGPPIQDLWLIIPGRDEWNIKQRDLLLSSYSELIDFDYDSTRLIEPLRALRLIHFNTWIAKRWEDPAFKMLFSNFGTPQYWREELYALEEIFQIMITGESF